MILVVAEHDRGAVAPATLEAMTAARTLAAASASATAVEALTIGEDGDKLLLALGEHGAERVHQVHDDLLTDYGPELWGDVVAQAVRVLAPRMVLACGTDRGNEVLAQAAARLSVPFAANCLTFTDDHCDGHDVGDDDGDDDGDGGVGDGLGRGVGVTRLRWGGSLLEDAVIDADVVVASVARHAVEATPMTTVADAVPSHLAVELDASLARSRVTSRVERAAGITLATAPVVVSGGRGVGSAAGFATLEELASLLGGVVGCSRVATNNGWRNHTDQVGQTGTRIAPHVYLACGISGAIQHWVGAMAAKHIIAINTDPEANMVTKADFAVIGDLHEVLPAITAEIRRRQGEDSGLGVARSRARKLTSA